MKISLKPLRLCSVEQEVVGKRTVSAPLDSRCMDKQLNGSQWEREIVCLPTYFKKTLLYVPQKKATHTGLNK